MPNNPQTISTGMNLLIFGLFMFGVANGSIVKELVEKELESKSEEYVSACQVDVLKQYNLSIDCDQNIVSHGKECNITASYLNETTLARCENGQWIPGGTRTDYVGQKRVKRFLGWIIAGVVTAVGIIGCALFCREPKPPRKTYPPVFRTCPHVSTPIYADEGSTAAKVTWNEPTATDPDNNIERIKQSTNYQNGGFFQGTQIGIPYNVNYEVKDYDGLLATCSFRFTVKVRHCSPLSYPQNGKIACNKGNIYGSSCSYSCNPGYQLTNGAATKCQINGKWSIISSCAKIQCPVPENIRDGKLTCPDYFYQSVCQLKCYSGFTLQGPGYLQCQANKKWSKTGESSCKDYLPPVVDCITPQIFYADFGSLNTTVEWEEPKVVDIVDPHPILKKISGPTQGDILPVGSNVVEYQAEDEAGNKSPKCTVELRVQAISCDDPRTSFGDDKLVPECSERRYYYGVSCDLSCDYNLPLNGSRIITCNKTVIDGVPTGIWDWGIEHEPHCLEVNCPTLDPPINGALAYDSINQRPVVIVLCNRQYDIPVIPNFRGQIFCLDSGSWIPLNKTPDCIEKRQPGRIRLPSELYYYSGQCGNKTTLNEIKNNFLDIISDTINPLFDSVCPDDTTCVIENVRVECGPVGRRRKRTLDLNTRFDSKENNSQEEPSRLDQMQNIERREQSHVTIFVFDIITTILKSNNTFEEAVKATDDLQKQQKDLFRSLVVNHTLDMDGFLTKSDSFQTAQLGSFACDRGMALDGNECKPCPSGMYLDETEMACMDCPVGQYQDTEGSVSCKRCAAGYSTLQGRTKLASNCTKKCEPGSVSATSLEPCSQCPVGTYQGNAGQRECFKCPRGLTTAMSGSYGITDCQVFDVMIKSTNRDELITSITSNESLSVIFWARLLSENAFPHTAFKFTNGPQDVLTINISPMISVQIGDMFSTGIRLSTARWSHIIVVLDRIDSLLQVYVDGNIEIENKIKTPVFPRGSFLVYSQGDGGIYTAGVNVIESVLNTSEIFSLLNTCVNYMDRAIVSMDSFMSLKSSGISFVTPAVCDAIDECSSSPCGEHKCINEAGDFRCICSNGRSGKTCEIAPDFCIENECKGNATCENLDSNYTCVCRDGYTGSFCEIPPVNGEWSAFGEWSECSVSCGGGEQMRSRICDQPPPGLGGLNCSGSNFERKTCNTEPCKECGQPWRSYGIIPNCSTDTSINMKYCRPYCRNGTILPSGLDQFETYNCGSYTNFTWIPLDAFPDCVDPVPPRRFDFNTKVDYAVTISDGHSNRVVSKIKENLQRSDCQKLANCTMTVALEKAKSRRKRNTGSTLQISMTVPISHTGNLDAGMFFQNGTVSEGLREIVDAIVALELTAADIQANASSLFNMEVDGVSFIIEESSLTLSGKSECPTGHIETEGFCVECPVGTRSETNQCSYCEVGTYQDETGQHVCKQCPKGLTTARIGTVSVYECIEQGYIDSTTTPAKTSSVVATPEVEESPVTESQYSAGLIAGITVGSSALILFAILVAVIYRRKTRKQKMNLIRSKPAHKERTGFKSTQQSTNQYINYTFSSGIEMCETATGNPQRNYFTNAAYESLTS